MALKMYCRKCACGLQQLDIFKPSTNPCKIMPDGPEWNCEFTDSFSLSVILDDSISFFFCEGRGGGDGGQRAVERIKS